MDSIYRDNILDHFKNPRNFGLLNNFDIESRENNDLCGDKIGIQIKMKIHSSNSKIDDIKFQGEGCAITMASASMLTELVKDKKISEVMKMKTQDVLAYLGISLTPNRIKCALLPLEAIQKAIVSLQKNMI